MFIIDHVAVEQDVTTASFCCDLATCKGACCTLEGGRGAPLEDQEVDSIREALEAVKPMLSEESLSVIRKQGVVEGNPGDYVTPCISEKACVYAIIEHGIALCSFERAFLRGLTTFRKPISCHLFPIRKSSGNRLRYEHIAECDSGRILGRKMKTPLHMFLKEPLVRSYGKEWFDTLVAHSEPGSDNT